MKNEMKNDEAVSPVIATILMVAITVVLAGVLYVWASELAGNQTEAGSLNQYKAEDHPSATSDQMTDNLLRLSFTNAPDDLEWALLTITLFDEEDGKTYMCTPGGADCTVTEETADSIWKANESIGIAEGGSTDICGAAGGAEGNSCELKIQISYNGVTLSGTSGIVAVA